MSFFCSLKQISCLGDQMESSKNVAEERTMTTVTVQAIQTNSQSSKYKHVQLLRSITAPFAGLILVRMACADDQSQQVRIDSKGLERRRHNYTVSTWRRRPVANLIGSVDSKVGCGYSIRCSHDLAGCFLPDPLRVQAAEESGR